MHTCLLGTLRHFLLLSRGVGCGLSPRRHYILRWCCGVLDCRCLYMLLLGLIFHIRRHHARRLRRSSRRFFLSTRNSAAFLLPLLLHSISGRRYRVLHFLGVLLLLVRTNNVLCCVPRFPPSSRDMPARSQWPLALRQRVCCWLVQSERASLCSLLQQLPGLRPTSSALLLSPPRFEAALSLLQSAATALLRKMILLLWRPVSSRLSPRNCLCLQALCRFPSPLAR
mmetsp:Transcript_12065/g.28422  ORF Transcript_12065/g.28422 Transcript_12065/m.28422 type:complete len:226 (-) Transcript_12065:910-1587(-)